MSIGIMLGTTTRVLVSTRTIRVVKTLKPHSRFLIRCVSMYVSFTGVKDLIMQSGVYLVILKGVV